MRQVASIMFALVLAAELRATNVVLQRDGVVFQGGEVCRFAAGDRDDPFKRWLESDRVVCVAAGPNVTFPPGLWNVFARIDGQAIGAPRLLEGSRAPSQLTFSLERAGAIVDAAPPGVRAAFYVPRLAYAIPAEARTTVPAGEELWLFLIPRESAQDLENPNRKIVVKSLLSVPAVGAATTRSADARPRATSEVIGWLRVPPEFRTTVRKLRETARAEGVVGKDFVLEADPLPEPARLHGAFVRVRGLPAGSFALGVGGKGWLSDARGGTVEDAVTIVPAALDVRPAGSLFVNWSRVRSLHQLNDAIGVCSRDRKRPQLEIALSRCAAPTGDELVDSTTCRIVNRTAADALQPHGSYALNDLAPGFYQAEMRFGNLPPVSGTATVVAHEQRNVYVRADYEQIAGDLTKGGKAIAEPATLTFEGSNGIGASLRLLPNWALQPPRPPRAGPSDKPDPEARRRAYENFYTVIQVGYQAVVKTLPQTDSKIEVMACDGDPRVTILADAVAKPGERFNLVIPDNEIRFRVIDTYTQAVLPGAAIRYTVLSKSEPHTPVLTGVVWTDREGPSEGSAKLTSLPERKTTFAVSYPGYDRQTVGPFTFKDREERTIEVQMVPARGGRSKIASDAEFVNGAVYWYSADGIQKEVVELHPDGTFFSSGSHSSNEIMAVISESHPLWVRPSPAVDSRRGVEIAFPSMQAREIDVVIADDREDEAHHVGLVIGGVRVPIAALVQHQSVRRQRSLVRPSVPLRLTAIGESGPIDVLLGPPVNQVPSRWQGMDIFTLPRYSDAPKERVEGESSGVVFDEP